MHHQLMMLALNQAKEAGKMGEVPVGAVIYDSTARQVIAQSCNQVECDHNATLHAEMLAIKQACEAKQTARLNNCYLYVTLEPCPMCAYAISLARIERLYFGAYDPKGGGVEHGPRIFHSDACHHKPEVYGGLEEQASAALLKDFFRQLR